MSAAADGGGLDLPCSQPSTVRTGTRSRPANTALDLFGRESGQWRCLDPGRPQGARAGSVLLNLAQSFEDLRSDFAFSHA